MLAKMLSSKQVARCDQRMPLKTLNPPSDLDGGHIKCPVRAVPAHLDQTVINAVGLYSLIQIISTLGQNYGCDVYFTDNAVIIAHAPASIAPPITANGRLSVAYTQLNTTRKENVVAQESMFIPVFSLCMSRI